MSDLPTSVLGRTGETVTKLAYGAMELRGRIPGRGGRDISPAEAGTILNAVLDAGITLIDTSPDYGRSEELIGEFISNRRSEFFLSSKCGCPINPPEGERPPHVFTRANVRAGVEQSLKRMKTDHIDLVQFHISPSRAELEKNDSVAELVDQAVPFLPAPEECVPVEPTDTFIGVRQRLDQLGPEVLVFDGALEEDHRLIAHALGALHLRQLDRQLR